LEKKRLRTLWKCTIFTAALLASIMLTAGCSGPTSTPGPATTGTSSTLIKIGGTLPLTGVFASGGVESLFGYNQAVQDINATGGIYIKELGAKLQMKLKITDDESDPIKCMTSLDTMASLDKVCSYLGSYSSETNAAAVGVAEKNKIPIVAGSFGVLAPHQQGYKYMFVPWVKTDSGTELIFQLFDTLPKEQRPTKIAVWNENTDQGEETKRLVPEAAKRHGATVVYNETYSDTALDFTSLILGTKTAGAEVVICVNTPTQALLMAKQMKQLDYNPKAYVFWRGCGAPLWEANLGKSGSGAMYVSNWNWNFGYPGNKELVQAYRAAKATLPSVTVGTSYADVQIIANAIERAGSLDPSKIKDALAATKDLMTVQGPIKEFRTDGVGMCPAAIMQWQDEVTQTVFHELYKSAPMIYPLPSWSQR
jgi:branched-chain amino acid transport system substrate-binding protein